MSLIDNIKQSYEIELNKLNNNHYELFLVHKKKPYVTTKIVFDKEPSEQDLYGVISSVLKLKEGLFNSIEKAKNTYDLSLVVGVLKDPKEGVLKLSLYSDKPLNENVLKEIENNLRNYGFKSEEKLLLGYFSEAEFRRNVKLRNIKTSY